MIDTRLRAFRINLHLLLNRTLAKRGGAFLQIRVTRIIRLPLRAFSFTGTMCTMKLQTRPNEPGHSSRYLAPAAVVTEYGLSARQLKFLRNARRLAFIRAGHRSVLFDRQDLDAFFAARRVAATSTGGA